MKVPLYLPVLMSVITPVIISASPSSRIRRDTEYNIDVLAVVDWKLFDHWLDLSQQQETQAEESIRKYIALVFKGVNHRYSNIEDFKLSVNLADITIFKDKATAQITDAIANLVSANKTLHKLSEYVKSNGLTMHDHVVLFTGHDIFSIDDGALFTYTSGQAFVGTMCQGSQGASVSVIEDRGAFQSIPTLAHELAHSLNASHDGNHNTCRLQDRYIMAGGSSTVTAANVFNPWYFSTCSKLEIASFLSKSTQKYGSCLNDAMQKTTKVPDVRYEDMGQLYSPDDLCRHIYGRNSYYCRTADEVSKICHSMYCFNVSTVNKCNEHYAPDFTSCGNRKWCVNGQCVFSENAPPKDDSCVYGNEPSANINGKTCTDLIAESVAYCYNSTVRERCCQTCKNIFTGIEGCEYGDKQLGCTHNFCQKIRANGDIIDELCCGTCSFRPKEWMCLDSITTPGLDCTKVQGDQCYNTTIAFYCCARCTNLREPSNKGCEYGDKEIQCSSLTNRGRRCDEKIKPFCCRTCAEGTVNSQSRVTLSSLVWAIVIMCILLHI